MLYHLLASVIAAYLQISSKKYHFLRMAISDPASLGYIPCYTLVFHPVFFLQSTY